MIKYQVLNNPLQSACTMERAVKNVTLLKILILNLIHYINSRRRRRVILSNIQAAKLTL